MAQPIEDYDQPTRIAPRHVEPKALVILDRYRIVKLLGHGGMGKVYLGYHTSLNRYAAIKTIRTDSKQRRTGLVDRFLLEMKASGKINHQNVVLAHDAGSTNGVLHIVMDYLPGHDLGQIASAYGKLLPADACELVRQTALGLQAIHKEMIHRDIKPSNLMLTPSGVLKILDLGLARLNESDHKNGLTPSGFVLGTHDYMSPEQAMGGDRVDHRADIYSLGCTFFRLLAGHAPYEGEEYSSSAQKINAHQNVPINTVRDFETIPPVLQAILVRMTAKNPADRYECAADVAEALVPYCVGQNVSALVQEPGPNELDAEPLSRFQREDAELLATGILADTDRDSEQTPFADDATPTRLAVGALVQSPRRARRYAAVAAVVLACLGAIGAYYSITSPNRGIAAKPTLESAPAPPLFTGAHSVDDLPKHQENILHNRVPLATPPIAPGQNTWNVNPDTQRVTVNYPDPILLQFGITRSKDYTIQASLNQVPWTGEAGLFWGYRELPDAAQLKLQNKPYAGFHYVYLCKREGSVLKPKPVTYTMIRGRGEVWIDARGTTCVNRIQHAEHPLPWISATPKTLELEVCDGSLQRATFNGIPLESFRQYEPDVRKNPAGADGFGIVTFGYHATFDNLRFMSTTTTGE